MIRPCFCVGYKADIMRGVHHEDDRYMLALYPAGADLTPYTKEYSPSGEISGPGYPTLGVVRWRGPCAGAVSLGLGISRQWEPPPARSPPGSPLPSHGRPPAPAQPGPQRVDSWPCPDTGTPSPGAVKICPTLYLQQLCVLLLTRDADVVYSP